MNSTSNHEHHTMRYAGLRSNYYEFLCDACGRHMLIHANPSAAGEDEQTLVVLKQGDCWTTHSGATGGFVVNSVQVNEDQAELSDEWKAWLAEILDEMDSR
jgi:hypothetical protein